MPIRKLALEDEQLLEIGKITAYFSMLEDMVAMCIMWIIGEDQRLGRIFTTRLGFTQKVELFNSLYHYVVVDKERIKQVESLVTRLNDVGMKRNEITHSIWAASTSITKVTRAKPSLHKIDGIRWRFEEMSTEDLSAVVTLIGELLEDMQEFFIKNYE